MALERRTRLLFGALAVVLVAAGGWWFQSGGALSSSSGTPEANARQNATAPIAAPEVHLKALSPEHEGFVDASRNLFRFKPKAPPPPPPASARVVSPGIPAPTGPPPTPPVPPIALKFIGIVETADKSRRLAVLSDGRGTPFSGKEGDIIEGRYRILRIGNESIDMVYLDGRGRQSIRLSGS